MTGVSQLGIFRNINNIYLLTTSVWQEKSSKTESPRFFIQNVLNMDSPLNFKEKFKTLINKTKVGNDAASPDSTLADFELRDFVKNSGYATRTSRITSAISINRGRIQGKNS